MEKLEGWGGVGTGNLQVFLAQDILNSILRWVLAYKVSCIIGVNTYLCLIGVLHLYSYSIHTASLKVFVSQPVCIAFFIPGTEMSFWQM